VTQAALETLVGRGERRRRGASLLSAHRGRDLTGSKEVVERLIDRKLCRNATAIPLMIARPSAMNAMIVDTARAARATGLPMRRFRVRSQPQGQREGARHLCCSRMSRGTGNARDARSERREFRSENSRKLANGCRTCESIAEASRALVAHVGRLECARPGSRRRNGAARGRRQGTFVAPNSRISAA